LITTRKHRAELREISARSLHPQVLSGTRAAAASTAAREHKATKLQDREAPRPQAQAERRTSSLEVLAITVANANDGGTGSATHLDTLATLAPQSGAPYPERPSWS